MEEDRQLQQFVSAIPKVELHAHLNGCIREETLFELAKERNVKLSSSHFGHHHQHHQHHHDTPSTTNNNQEEEHLYSYMYNKKPRSLTDCFEMFAEIPKCVDDREALQRITREALEDFACHHVVYLELRSTPKRMKGLTKKQYIETVLDVMKNFEEQEEKRFQSEQSAAASGTSSATVSTSNDNNNHVSSSSWSSFIRLPMKCRFIVSIDRSGSVMEAEENVDLAVELFQIPNSLVVGMDIGGNPFKNDFRDFLPSISRARNQAGLKITVHCGKSYLYTMNMLRGEKEIFFLRSDSACYLVSNGHNLLQILTSLLAEVPVGESDLEDSPQLLKSYQEVAAIFEFRPNRIGHALLLPPSLRNELMHKWNIPVESCPTSNVMTLELAKHMGGNLIHGLQEHPQLKYWLEKKFPISIGTDDPGVFNTNATQELLLLARAWKVPLGELKRIVLDSMDQGFCSAALKTSIKKRMEECFSAIQQNS